MQEIKFTSPKHYLFGLLFSIRVKEDPYRPKYTSSLLIYPNVNDSQTFKSSSYQKFFCPVCVQGQRQQGGPGRACSPPPFFCVAKRKSETKGKKERLSKQKRLSPRSKCYCFSDSRASRIQKFFWSANHGGRQYLSVFHGPSTLKSISPAWYVIDATCFDELILFHVMTGVPNFFQKFLVTARVFQPPYCRFFLKQVF